MYLQGVLVLTVIKSNPMNLLTENVLIGIRGNKYRISKEEPKLHDLVFDREDGMYGKISHINNYGFCSIGTGHHKVIVPISRLWKLELYEKILKPFAK